MYRVSTKSNLNFEDCSPGLDTLPPKISPPEISNVRLVGIEEILGLEALDIAIETAEQTQTPCYLVGGVLRDALLHRPVKDIDLLVLGSGPDFAEAWAANLPGRPKVHAFKNFGTAMVHHNGLQFEVVGARKESYDRDSRKPVVSTGTLEDDLARRDFSINALAFELYPQYGRWIDNYNGIRDLEARRLVTPLEPTLTFSDDPLRMLRAARFAAQLGFELDPETIQAMGREAVLEGGRELGIGQADRGRGGGIVVGGKEFAAAVGLAKTQGGHGSQSRTGEIMNMITGYGSAAKPQIPALKELIASFNADVERREFPGGDLNNQRVGAVENAIRTIEAAQDHPPLRSVTSASAK